MVIKFYLYEGRQYKVGSVNFTGNKLFNAEEIHRGLQAVRDFQHSKAKLGPHGLVMDTGNIFTPDGLNKDTQAVEDFYGSKGYIDVQRGPTLRAEYIPNVETGTMDLEFQIKEGQKSYVEKIDIRGNEKTKDKVIRRELAISPGEVFDMVRVEDQQATPRRPAIFLQGGHAAGGDRSADCRAQGLECERGGTEHGQLHARRRIQLGGRAGRLCGGVAGQFRPVPSAHVHRRPARSSACSSSSAPSARTMSCHSSSPGF